MTRQEFIRARTKVLVEEIALGGDSKVGWSGAGDPWGEGRLERVVPLVQVTRNSPRPMLTDLYISDVTAWGWTLM
jgi:hypothetical protein